MARVRSPYRFTRIDPQEGLPTYEVRRRYDDKLLGTVRRCTDLGLRSGTVVIFEPYTPQGEWLYCAGTTRHAAAKALDRFADGRRSRVP